MLPPAPKGRPRKLDLRDVWKAIMYRASSGCQWDMLPRDFPPSQSVQYWFYKFRDDGTFEAINAALTEAARLLEDRKAKPTATIIDSQSVKTTESGGPCAKDWQTTITSSQAWMFIASIRRSTRFITRRLKHKSEFLSQILTVCCHQDQILYLGT